MHPRLSKTKLILSNKQLTSLDSNNSHLHIGILKVIRLYSTIVHKVQMPYFNKNTDVV